MTAGESESDVPADPHVAHGRETGGRAHGERDHDDDAESTTGVEQSETFVGRVAGADEGYEEETGAEARREGEQG